MAKARSPKPKQSKGKTDVSARLDEVLPLFEPTAPELHLGAAVLEAGDPIQLLELASDSALRPFLLCRLSDKVALVDPGRAGDLADALRKHGHTPKIDKS